ncbi:MAG: PAS domain-containing protein, partial [Candidatus Aquicultor sp.]
MKRLLSKKSEAKDKGKETEDSVSLLAGIPDPLFVADKDLNITYFNDAVAELTGYSPEEAKGMKCHDVFRSNICDSGCAIKHCMATDSSIRGAEVIIRKRNGEPVTIIASGAPVKDSSGNIIGGMETMRDVTEEKKREALVAAEAARGRAGIYDAIFTTDTERKITYFNDAAEKLTGYSKQEAIGKRCRDIFNSNICDTGCAVKACMINEEPIMGAEVMIKNRNMREIPVVARADI